MKKKEEGVMEKIVSLCKRRGFIYQGSEIYGGLAGTWDYGPLGTTLKKNIENLWWRQFVESRDDMYGIDSSTISSGKIWEASGHVSGFSDPMVEDTKTKKRYRADHVLEDVGIDPTGMSLEEMSATIQEKKLKSPDGNPFGDAKKFNMLFPVRMGSTDGAETVAYLRGETAQGMFVNFKNIIDSFHPKLPFGIAQIGKAYRNEIAPRDFIFRVRELELMEFEYFIVEKEWEERFEYWRNEMHRWFENLGFEKEDIKEVEVGDADRAHYSKRTMDFYFNYPFGYKEIAGFAYRTDYDLKNHFEHSGADLQYLTPEGTRFIPHVLEPTFGLGRHVLAVIAKAYTEDELGGEKRVVLKFPPHVAPVKAAVFPLLKNKPDLVAKAREIYTSLKKEIPQVVFDDNGNIGKRYRRQDEIGTPWCITIDFDTLSDATVTVRERDSGEQRRVAAGELAAHLKGRML